MVTGRTDWDPSELIHPIYRRLAMGETHSVDLISIINRHLCGKSLVRSRRLHLTALARSKGASSTTPGFTLRDPRGLAERARPLLGPVGAGRKGVI